MKIKMKKTMVLSDRMYVVFVCAFLFRFTMKSIAQRKMRMRVYGVWMCQCATIFTTAFCFTFISFNFFLCVFYFAFRSQFDFSLSLTAIFSSRFFLYFTIFLVFCSAVLCSVKSQALGHVWKNIILHLVFPWQLIHYF